MRTKQTIAIIGLGEAGRAVAGLLALGRERVLLFDKQFTEAQSLAVNMQQDYPSYDVEAITCSADACWEADIIVPAVSSNELAEVAAYIQAYANQKIVVSIAKQEDSAGKNFAATLQKLLPHSKIVTIYYKLLVPSTNAWIERNDIELIAEGLDEDAVETINILLTALGFTVQPIIAQEA